MLREVINETVLLLVFMALLTFERVIGLPTAAFLFLATRSSARSERQRWIFAGVAGVLIGIVYHLPFALSLLLAAGLVFWQGIELPQLSHRHLKTVIGVLLGIVAVWLWARPVMTLGGLMYQFSLLVVVAVLWGVGQRWIASTQLKLPPRRRYSHHEGH